MENKDRFGISRRDFIKGAGASVLATTTGLGAAGAVSAREQKDRRYNILMIVTDQQTQMSLADLPDGYRLPGQEKLRARGVVFENHQIASCVCTPSRAVIYTGQHIQKNGMFDNTNFPWQNDLSTDIPTVGDMLRSQGYYTAYKGKWHLSEEFHTANDLHMPKRLLVEEMEAYGFSDYFGIGDIIGGTNGGYLHDGVIASMTKSWLRGKAQELRSENRPWFKAVNLVNPHDVMYYNTDLPGEPPRQAATAMMRLNRDPQNDQYSRQWDLNLPKSRNQPFSGPGRPAAHEAFANARGALVGRVPNEDDRWRRLNNYYLNCTQSVDSHLLGILNELDNLSLTDETIIILTSDHGELGGAHGLNGKGATAYREQQNVPFIMSHPGYAGGKRCKAVTSHVDIATTLVSLAGGQPGKQKNVPGADISALLDKPETAALDAIRPGALFNFNMLAFVDDDFLMKVSRFLREGGKPSDIPAKGWQPDLKKRGAIRSVFDGRYKLNRYFSPLEHHQPRSIEELFAINDVEVFDLESDPHEMTNLAVERNRHGDLILAMNEKLNSLIDVEVGEDTGQMLPGGGDSKWTIDPSVSNLRM
jgi:arylsulfatase A-like enzyme